LSNDRENTSKEDETIVNHFHGVSSSSEDRRDVYGKEVVYLFGGKPSQVMEFQEMDVDGQDSSEKPEDPIPIEYFL
jgi:hypothetical protein